mgnify:FL=1|jgi:hypothetical protein
MEVEYGGIKATGGKLFVILSLLGTIGGGLWGGFELLKRYEDMEAKISEYVAPDLSGFDKRIEVIMTTIKEKEEANKELFIAMKTETSALKELVVSAQETARDIRTDIKGDVGEVMDQISAIDKRSRADGLETRQAMRTAENEIRSLVKSSGKDVRDLIQTTETRWDDKLTKVDTRIEGLEKKINKKIQKALENPLAAMTKTK